MTRKPEEKPNGFTREEAKLTLDTILKRYGIHPSDQPAREQRKPVPLAASRMLTKELLPEPITTGPAAANKPFAPVRQVRLGVAPLNEPKHGSASDEGFADKPEGELPTEYQDFHYLIRIVECAVTLHCQVRAESAAEARLEVQRIPNLIEWREISAKELAELTETE
jgi:hypothetical protein